MLQTGTRLCRCVGAWRHCSAIKRQVQVSVRAAAARRNPQAAFSLFNSRHGRDPGLRLSTIALAGPTETETVEMEVGPLAATASTLHP